MAGVVSQKGKSQTEESMQRVDLTTLSLPQLAQLKQQLEQVSFTWLKFTTQFSWNVIWFFFFKDLNLYQESLQTLKIAQTKFQESADSAEKLDKMKEGCTILVPLTGSVNIVPPFVAISIKLTKKILLDVCSRKNQQARKAFS